jgi:LPS sulfotransferase NodH
MTAAQLLEAGFSVGEGDITSTVQVVGFKVLDEQIIPTGPCEAVLDLLAMYADLRVLVLKRTNMLESVRSRVQAAQTQWYHQSQDGPDRAGPNPVVRLDYEFCLSAFQQAERFYAEIDCRFPADRTLHITYEDVCGDFSATTSRVLGFLGVRAFPLRSALIKLESRPAEQTVANYADLENAFRGSRYHQYFHGEASEGADES